MRIAEKSTIATSIEAGVWPGVSGKVAVTAGLFYFIISHNQTQRPHQAQYERTQMRPAFQLLGTVNETLVKAAACHLHRSQRSSAAKHVRHWPSWKIGNILSDIKIGEHLNEKACVNNCASTFNARVNGTYSWPKYRWATDWNIKQKYLPDCERTCVEHLFFQSCVRARLKKCSHEL